MSDDAERRADEISALIVIYDDACEVVSDSRARVTLKDDVDDSKCVVELRLGENYPSSAALEVCSTSTETLTREDEAKILSRARACAEACAGAESAYDVLTETESVFREVSANARREARREAVKAAKTEEAVEEEYHAVVKIDHMNDSVGYLKLLRKFCESSGVGARVLHAEPPEGAGKRVEGVFVALSGSNDGIKTFISRLRTEFVDVDAKGVKCRERKATTLCHRANSTVKVGERAVESFSGFETLEPYATENDLEQKLALLNLLHVGDGSSRFVSTS